MLHKHQIRWLQACQHQPNTYVKTVSNLCCLCHRLENSVAVRVVPAILLRKYTGNFQYQIVSVSSRVYLRGPNRNDLHMQPPPGYNYGPPPPQQGQGIPMQQAGPPSGSAQYPGYQPQYPPGYHTPPQQQPFVPPSFPAQQYSPQQPGYGQPMPQQQYQAYQPPPFQPQPPPSQAGSVSVPAEWVAWRMQPV